MISNISHCTCRTAGEASSAEYILVDDGSTENISVAVDTGRQLQHLFQASFKYVRNRRPVGYGLANNVGVQLAQAEHVALINSDTMVVSGWLRPLLDSLSFNNRSGMVCPYGGSLCLPPCLVMLIAASLSPLLSLRTLTCPHTFEAMLFLCVPAA